MQERDKPRVIPVDRTALDSASPQVSGGEEVDIPVDRSALRDAEAVRRRLPEVMARTPAWSTKPPEDLTPGG